MRTENDDGRGVGHRTNGGEERTKMTTGEKSGGRNDDDRGCCRRHSTVQ